ncbi:MAG: anthranilate synthase component I [Candidatus Magasanikbacteria bacterium RIFOXYD2_FULL_41_14]|uniref:Anthranilate synthase component I n=1 Tax=Candidatus Magasanikbacteria bacterium RIFOXYD2_FULL_41_14 TaxID=1798709 RepID=A0A1F6PD26_9BACT|nr:MAG: anthranilate synthase component I [Candidatus Magasanikbacteria bacterium RIFOXYD2_FULL_41_14]
MNLPKFNINKKAKYLTLAIGASVFDLFKKISQKYQVCYFAESLGESRPLSRYSFIGFDPEHFLRARGKDLFIDDVKYAVPNPYYALRSLIPQDCIGRRYAGGLFGYLSYEAVNYLEPILKIKTHPLFPEFQFGLYTDGLIYDNLTAELIYFYYNTNRSEIIRAILDSPSEEVALPQVRFRGDNVSEPEHKILVENVKKEIIAGNIFQCEVGIKSEYKITGDPIAIYESLRVINPSPYMFYLRHQDIMILGASPELLVKVEQGDVETRPLAGTIARGATPAENAINSRKLLHDPKEIAEHTMLVDMHRNDIGRVADFGSVKVTNLMDVKKFSHVQHIESAIRGNLRPSCDMFDALAALLPGGVLSGSPKIESMKIIDRQEKEARGPYGGAVGAFNFNGDCTFTIPIRSLYIKGDYAFSQTSSGIVYDSVPEKEYLEVQNKARAMRTALTPFLI